MRALNGGERSVSPDQIPVVASPEVVAPFPCVDL